MGNLAIGIDDVGNALGITATVDIECSDQVVVGVNQEGEIQIVLCRKCMVGSFVIRAHAQHSNAFLEISRLGIAKAASFFGTAWEGAEGRRDL